jgi:fused signal recognition particle receptor
VCEKALGPGAVSTLLVLDANLGQNSLVQAREFTRRLPTDGIILTKLDSTARGGIVIAIRQALGIPVSYIGAGEGIDDFDVFDAERFVDALLG